MVKQFLDTLWPLFGFARLLGMFPCKRISNEDGNIVLKPINGKLQWLIYCCTEALIIFSALSATSWHFFKSQRSFEEVQKCQYNLWGGESIVDLLTFLAVLALISLGSIMVQYGTFKMRHGLCDLSFQLDRNLKEDPLLLTFLTVSGLFVPPVICNSLLTGWLMVECLNLNWIDVVPTLILSFLQIMNGYVPLIVFFALTLECFSCLAYEIQQVRQHVEDRKLNITILDRVANVMKKLEDVRLLLSNNLFWIMVIGSIEILVMLYLVPAYFINYSKSKESVALLGAGSMLLYVICFCTLMWVFNIAAQRITYLVHRLKSDLQDIYVPEQSFMVMYEDQIVPASFMNDRIIDKLNNFDGFDGKGYFVLGKSFLKNFLAFCATYFVILLQFKLSE